jgi:glycosyltransferase involved in cell wall biosynthesis
MTQPKGGLAIIFWGPSSLSTDDYGKKLNSPVYKINSLEWRRTWLAPFRYILMFFKTWKLLREKAPDAVLVINTPVFAPLCVYLFCRQQKIPYVMNVHGHSFIGWKWGWARSLQRFLAKRALTNLVGIPEYEELFNSWGASAILLERPMAFVDPEILKVVTEPGTFNVTLTSTFALDEPIDLVVEAAKQLPDIQFYILGDTRLARSSLLSSAPKNVIFPGYLKSEQYWSQLYSSQVIMTLTTTPYSLVSGGVEALSLRKPMILSCQPALTDYFTKGTVFVDHTVESIVDAVKTAQQNHEKLTEESAELNFEKRKRWDESFNYLVDLLGDKVKQQIFSYSQ